MAKVDGQVDLSMCWLLLRKQTDPRLWMQAISSSIRLTTTLFKPKYLLFDKGNNQIGTEACK